MTDLTTQIAACFRDAGHQMPRAFEKYDPDQPRDKDGRWVDVRRSPEDPNDVADASFEHATVLGDQERPINSLRGGVDVSQPSERARVDALKDKMTSPGGYLARLLVDDEGNVLEGQHRFTALQELGAQDIPVTAIRDNSVGYDVDAMRSAIRGVSALHADQVHQIIGQALELLQQEGSPQKVLDEYEFPPAYRKHFEAALNASVRKTFDPNQPRAPKGTAEGGQWTTGNESQTMTSAEWKQLQRDLESMTDARNNLRFYHITTKENAEKIKEEGLIPGKSKPIGQDWAPEYSGKGTYFHSAREAVVNEAANLADMGIIDDYAVVAVNLPLTRKNMARIVPDEDVSLDPKQWADALRNREPVAIFGHIEPNNIHTVVPASKWVQVEKHTLDKYNPDQPRAPDLDQDKLWELYERLKGLNKRVNKLKKPLPRYRPKSDG